MPKIASSHLMEARALTRVQSILAESDALSEVTKNDYGEDLIVQTHHKGQADPFQILIQVKGSGNIKSNNGSFSFRFELDHLYRWVAQAGSVLVCVYDDQTKRVFAFSPKERFSLWQILTTRKKTLRVVFKEEDDFTADSARIIIWDSRVEHFSNMLALSENRQHYVQVHDTPKSVKTALRRETGVICLLFLKTVGMIIGDEFSERVRKQIRNGSSYFPKEWPDEPWSLRHIMMFTLIGEVNEATGCGVPDNIMEQVTEAAGHFYKSFHLEEWNAAECHMSMIWVPYKGHTSR